MSSSPNISVVEITYSSPGARPPIYVVASFTLPAWQPQELEYRICREASNHSSCEYQFFKRFHVSVGTWQYKFRLGTGDWWACDEQHEIVMDAMGNYNNLLIVKASSKEDLEPFRDAAQIGDASKDSLEVQTTQGSDSQSDHDVSECKPESCKYFDRWVLAGFTAHLAKSMDHTKDMLIFMYHETGHNAERSFRQENDPTVTRTEDEQPLLQGNYHFSEGVQRRNAVSTEPSARPRAEEELQPLATTSIWQKFWQWLSAIVVRLCRL